MDGGISGNKSGAYSKIDKDPEEQFLRITDIVLTEIKEEDNGEEEINDDGEVVKKEKDKKGPKIVSSQPRASTVSARNSVSVGNLAEEPDDHADLDNSDLVGVDKKDRFRRNKQFNDKYEIDKFLLFLIFAKKTNRGMRN